MKNKFVETSNVQNFMHALTALENRGASEACLIVVDGLPGLGKTTTLQHWVARNGCVYLRAKKEWTPSWMLRELLDALRVTPPHAIQEKYRKALEELGERQMSAGNANQMFGLVIDEADHISNSPRLLETIRDLSDMLEIPTILIGMGKINDNLKRFPQVSSRVSQRVRFEQASLEDVTKMFDELCEIKVAPDLQAFVHKVTQGFNRELIEAIAKIERFGFRNPPEDEGLTMYDMAGQALINDRRTSKLISVPGEL